MNQFVVTSIIHTTTHNTYMLITQSNITRIAKASSLVLLLAAFSSCNESKKNQQDNEKASNTGISDTSEKNSVEKEVPKEPAVAKERITYTAWPLKENDSAKKALKEKFTEDERYIIYALNRVDAKNYNRADTLIIPNKILGDFLGYSPFPASVAILNDVKKIIFFSYSIQAYAVYENGKLIKWGPTSMGSKAKQTPTGLSFTNWKSKRAISTVKSEWILPWNFNIRNKDGVGWHQYDLPGYPASHSCLRLLDADAQWLYGWADQWILKDNATLLANGTPVIVFGAYPWGERRPWKNLLENPEANNISEEMLKDEIAPNLEKILNAQRTRETIVAQTNTDNAKAI